MFNKPIYVMQNGVWINKSETIPQQVYGTLLALTHYNPGTVAQYSATSGTYSDIDATNLAVTFTTPASGQVLIRLSIATVVSATSELGIGLREGTTDISGTEQRKIYSGAATQINAASCYTWVMSGLTPASAHTYKISHARTSGSGQAITRAGGLTGAAVIEVWSA